VRILVSNDDGINAPGLKSLTKIAKAISDDVWIVAPEMEQSGAAHSLTLTEPLRIRKLSARKFAVKGTPTDCVMLAMHSIVKGKRPDLVLSGVNRGGNLGEDVTYSGTVAAAMEGTLLRVPAIALSQVFTFGHPVKWATAEHHGSRVIKRLLKAGWPEDCLMNVNFPDVMHNSVKGAVICRQGRRAEADLMFDERIDARGVPYFWLGFRRDIGEPHPDSDLAVIARGGISVTPLQFDLTHTRTLNRLKKAF
jgi:5'-nucleotidase